MVLTLCYACAWAAPWHFDDHQYICQNPGIRTFEGLKSIALSGRRYLLWFSNYLCYALSAASGTHTLENPDVRVFRAWNLACHFGACLALYGLLRRVWKRDWRGPLCAALLFAAHPLAIESVTYISGRTNSQGGMFYLAGLYCAALALESMRARPGARWLWPALLSWICGAAAIATKESHVTFPLAVLLLYAAFYRPSKDRAALPEWPRRLFLGFTLLPGLLMALAVPYIYERVLRTFSGGEGFSAWRALATQANALPWMLGKTIVPLGLNIDPDFQTFDNFKSWQPLAGALLLALLAGWALRSAWRGNVACFAVALALLSILPTNSVIERGDVVSERNFYLAAACGSIVLTCLLALLPKWRTAASVVVLLTFIGLNMGRNLEFHDAYTLWRVTAERSPHRLRAGLNHALTALELEHFDEAQAAFKKVIETGREKVPTLRPDEALERQSWFLAFADLAAVKLHLLENAALPAEARKALMDDVEQLYVEGARVSHGDPDVSLAYAQFLLQTARPQQAAEVLRASVATYPKTQWLWGALGRAEVETGDYEHGIPHLEAELNATTVHPLGMLIAAPERERREALFYLGMAEIAQGDPVRIRRRFQALAASDSELLGAIVDMARERASQLAPAALTTLAALMPEWPVSAQFDALREVIRNELVRRSGAR